MEHVKDTINLSQIRYIKYKMIQNVLTKLHLLGLSIRKMDLLAITNSVQSNDFLVAIAIYPILLSITIQPSIKQFIHLT